MAQERIEFRSTPLEFDTRVESAGNQVLAATEALANTAVTIAKEKETERGKAEGQQQVADLGLAWRPAAKQDDLFGYTFQSVRDKAREGAAYAAFTARARIDIRDTNSRLANEHKNDPAAYTAAMDTYLAKQFEGLPEDFKSKISLIGEDYRSSTFTSLMNRQADIQEQVDLVDIIESNNILSDASIDYAAQGDYVRATENFDDLIVSWEMAVANGGMSAAQLVSNTEALKDKIDFNYHQGRIERLSIIAAETDDYEPIYDYMEALTKNKDFAVVSPIGLENEDQAYGETTDGVDRISEANRERLISLTNTVLNNHAASSTAIDKVALDDARNQFKGFQEDVTAGRSISLEDLQVFLDSTATLGNDILTKDINQFKAIYSYLTEDTFTEFGDRNTAFGNRNLRSMEAYLRALKVSDNTRDKDTLINMAESMYSAAKNADITYGADKGWYDLTPLTFDETLSDQLLERRESLAQLGVRLGETSATLFTDEETDVILAQLEKNPLLVREFAEGLGSETDKVIAALGIKNPIVGVAGILHTQGKNLIADSLFAGQTMLNETPENFPAADLWSKKFNKEGISGAFGNAPAHERAIKDAIQARYAVLASQRGIYRNDKINDKLMQQAKEDVMPPIVKIDVDDSVFNNDAITYSFPAPNPEWTWDNAQENTMTWLGNLGSIDLINAGVSVKDADMVINDKNNDGFENFRMVPYGNGYKLQRQFPTGYVKKEDGTDYILTYTDEVFNRTSTQVAAAKGEVSFIDSVLDFFTGDDTEAVVSSEDSKKFVPFEKGNTN